MNMVVGHFSHTPAAPQIGATGNTIEIYEQALRQIIKARQISHAKAIAKEALKGGSDTIPKVR